MKFLLLSFLAGIVSACGFAPWGLWPLTLAAFVALFLLVERAPSLRSALARGYWFGAGQFVLGLNWIATAFTFQAAMPVWLGWVAVVLLSLYLAVYPAMAAGLAWRWGLNRDSNHPRHPRESGDPPSSAAVDQEGKMDSRFRGNDAVRWNDGPVFILLFASAWVVTEWLRATMFTGFAWNPVGVALVPTPFAFLAQWVGTYGLSGATLLLAGGLLLLIRGQWKSGAGILGSVAIATAIAVAANAGEAGLTDMPIRIVQPNIGQQDKWREGFEAENFGRLARLTGAPAAEPRLLFWPEAAITDPLGDDRPAMAQEIAARRGDVARLLGPGDLLLTGGITISAPDGYRVTRATNSVFAIDASGAVLARFDKAHLVPYGEYLPMRPILSAIGLSRLAPGDLDYIPGPGPRTIDFGAFGRIGFQLCYEIIFSGAVVDRASRPDFIFNPSNDAWFGSFGPPQHLAQARLRAIEEGLPVIRATPTGISAVVDAKGRLLHSLPWRTAGVIDARLPTPGPPTLFARAGNILPFLFALLLVGIAIAVRRKTR